VVFQQDAGASKFEKIFIDVFTTGATVNECAKVLKEAGAVEVRVLAAARVILG